ncbi:MAG: serine hydrolase [Sphingomonadaceae bacterium]|nr:serine hydrolase [Sphingomonadaceae bacterium]
MKGLARLAVALAAVLATAAAPALAADPRVGATDALLRATAAADEPGLAVAVWHHGQVVYRGVRGLADLEQGTPLTPRSAFHLASLSKQMTGLAVLQLVAQGRIDLDADIHRYLPELPDFGATVRIRHLLSMTSGLKDQWALLRMSGRDWQDVFTQEMLRAAIARVPQLDFAPGSDYAYSNTNYLLLADIVARVEGRSFRAAMAADVFAPLGMADTLVQDELQEPIRGRVNCYYQIPGRPEWHRQLLAYRTWGATSVVSTIDDMARWGIALAGRQLGGKQLYAALAEPSTLTGGAPNLYRAGLYRNQADGRTTYEHGGADGSFRHYLRYFPSEDLGVVVLTNSERHPIALVDAVARLWLPAAGTPPPPAPLPPAPAPADLDGVYAGGRTDAAVRLFHRDGRLMLRSGDDDDQPLQVTPNGDLAVADGTAAFTAARDAAEHVTGLVEHNRVNAAVPFEVALHRLPPPPPLDPARFVGRYRNAALGITLSVRAEGGGLVLAPLNSELAFHLEATDRDRFEGWDYAFRTVRFDPGSGPAAGLTVDGDRAAGVRFVRDPDPLPPGG